MNNPAISRYTLILLLLNVFLTAKSQESYKIYGTIYDVHSGEKLIGANVKIKNTFTGTVSNMYGFYQLTIEASQPVELEISHMGYRTATLPALATPDTALNIFLEPGITLDEFTVAAQKPFATNKQQVGQLLLSPQTVKNLPTFGGESNIMLALKSLPGVSAGKEGSSELYVRGGSHDQNLILLDDAPVFNLNHAYGIVSVFNSSSLKNVSLYKGGIPSEYGGRLSSVLDVAVKEGNRKSYHGDFGLSVFAGTLSAEGPIIKDKASFMISARRTWPDLFVTGIAKNNNSEMVYGYYFMDINAKTNFTLKDKYHFYLSYYTGEDKLFVMSHTDDMQAEMEQGWGNQIFSARYQATTKNGAFNKILLYHSNFKEFDNNETHSDSIDAGQKVGSGLHETGLKAQHEWSVATSWSFKTGINALSRSVSLPQKESFQNEVKQTSVSIAEINQYEVAAFFNGKYQKNNWLLEPGIRLTSFGNEKIEDLSLEPRLSAMYHVNHQVSLKAGAMRNSQTLFAMSKGSTGIPGYTWLPTHEKLKPMFSNQASLGFTYQQTHFNFDGELYFKTMENIPGNYLYPRDLYQSTQWYSIIDQGKGRAYGADFLLEYFYKKTQVNLKYSLSKTEHAFTSVLDGAWIPSDYDIRHDLNVNGNWIFSENKHHKSWFTANFALHSGIPYSIPTQSAPGILPVVGEFIWEEYNTSSVDYYRTPNNSRLKTYHRLDICFHLQKEKYRGNRLWSLGILNVYNRLNPYAIFKGKDGNLKQYTLFPIMPTIAYKRTF